MSDYVEIEGQGIVYWPMCKVAGCGNRMNRSAGNGFCWPHQLLGLSFERMMEEIAERDAASAPGSHK